MADSNDKTLGIALGGLGEKHAALGLLQRKLEHVSRRRGSCTNKLGHNLLDENAVEERDEAAGCSRLKAREDGRGRGTTDHVREKN